MCASAFDRPGAHSATSMHTATHGYSEQCATARAPPVRMRDGGRETEVFPQLTAPPPYLSFLLQGLQSRDSDAVPADLPMPPAVSCRWRSLRPAAWPGPGRCSAAAGAALSPVQHGRRCSAAAGDLLPSAQPMVAGSVRLTRGCRSGPLLLVRPAGADPARGHGCRAAAGAGSLSVNAKQFSKCPK